jgi:hypothetical protein
MFNYCKYKSIVWKRIALQVPHGIGVAFYFSNTCAISKTDISNNSCRYCFHLISLSQEIQTFAVSRIITARTFRLIIFATSRNTPLNVFLSRKLSVWTTKQWIVKEAINIDVKPTAHLWRLHPQMRAYHTSAAWPLVATVTVSPYWYTLSISGFRYRRDFWSSLYFSWTCTCFRNGVSSSTRRGFGISLRRYLYSTVLLARGYPRCHNPRSLSALCTLRHCTFLRKI